MDHQFIGDAKTLFDVAVDSTHVYWTTGNAIGRANLDGTGVNESFITGVGSPCSVAVGAGHVYWTLTHTIGRANLDGTGVDRSFINTGGCGIAVDSARIYWAAYSGIARANLDGTGVNEGLISPPPIISGVAVDALFSNEFGFGKVKKNERKGTAKLTLKVPGPGGLGLRGNGIKTASRNAPRAGKVKLAVKPTGTAKQKLNQTGKAKLGAAVTYTPDGGTPDTPNTERKRIKLVKQR